MLQVADLDRSLVYYGRVLGLATRSREGARAELGPAAHEASPPPRGGAEGRPRDDAPPLLELVEHQEAAAVPRRGRLGLFHFAVLLPTREDLGRFARHLSDLGIRPGASDHSVSEALYLHDPDGLGIEVYADRPREQWRWHDGQLAMGTEPLDVAGLRRAGGAAPWAGVPSGTRMGHVHLHVGGLGRADDFYHRALGLDRTVWSYPGALFLSAGGYHHHLGVNTWAAGAGPAEEHEARLLEWELVLPSPDDVARAGESLAAAGHLAEPDGHPPEPDRGEPAGAGDRAGQRELVVSDPWGTRLRLRSETT